MNVDLPLAAELASLAAYMSPAVLTAESADTTLEVLTSLAAEAIAGAAGAGISLVDGNGTVISRAFTSAVVRDADALQYELDEGPCLTAISSRVTVRVADLRKESRWPRWTSAVLRLQLLSSVSVPLMPPSSDAAVAGRPLGAVKVYGDQPGFDEQAQPTVERLTQTAAVLLSSVSPADPQPLGSELREALRSRDAVQVATGVVMMRDGLSQDAAYQVLVGQARVGNRVLHEVAEEVLRSVQTQR